MMKGQSLFELVVAIGIVGLILLALVSLATLSVRNATFSRNEAEAARIGQEAIEWLRKERDSDWDAFVANTSVSPEKCFALQTKSWSDTHGLPCFASDQINSLYYREANFICLTDCDTNDDGKADRVEVVIKVHWTDGQGYHEIKNSTYFTDWRLQ